MAYFMFCEHLVSEKQVWYVYGDNVGTVIHISFKTKEVCIH